MRKTTRNKLIAWALVLAYFLSVRFTPALANEDSAYVHLNEVMDLYHLAFDLYSDQDAGGNHYYPSGFYNGDLNMSFNTDWRENAHSGFSCIKVIWNGLPGADGWKWNGVMWQEPLGNWVGNNGLGYNLSGATKVTFWARTEDPGLELIFMVGYPDDSCGEIRDTLELFTSWTEYEIDLSSCVLSDVCGGFAFIFNDELDPDPDGCTFYLDEIKYDLARPDSLRLLLSYLTDGSGGDKTWAVNQAYTYDNALALLAYLSRGTQDDLRRAKIIGDALMYAQGHDRFFIDGRLRNAYSAGDLSDHQTGDARLPSWWDNDSLLAIEDSYQIGTYTGEMAWVIIAWSSYHQLIPNAAFLNSAIQLGEWLYTNNYDTTGVPGYIGGFDGCPDSLILKKTWKSTEQNAVVYTAFYHLYQVSDDSIWWERTVLARDFVAAMWDQPTSHFFTGTTELGNINYVAALDPQTSSLLAGIDTSSYTPALTWTQNNCWVDTLGYQGFHYGTVRDGIWWEGTAQMQCTYGLLDQTTQANLYLEELRQWQASATGGNGKGIISCCPDSIWTGIVKESGEWWRIYSRLHIGATAWYLFAEQEVDPYWLMGLPPVGIEGKSPPLRLTQFTLYRNFPNPFNSRTALSYSVPVAGPVKIDVYNVAGSRIVELVNAWHAPGQYHTEFEGDGQSSGVYIAVLQAGSYRCAQKMVLLK